MKIHAPFVVETCKADEKKLLDFWAVYYMPTQFCMHVVRKPRRRPRFVNWWIWSCHNPAFRSDMK